MPFVIRGETVYHWCGPDWETFLAKTLQLLLSQAEETEHGCTWIWAVRDQWCWWGLLQAGEVMMAFLCRGLSPKAAGDSACQVHTHCRRTQLLAPAPSHTLHHRSLSDDFCHARKLASITDQFITLKLDQAPALQVNVAPAPHESTFNMTLKFSGDCF